MFLALLAALAASDVQAGPTLSPTDLDEAICNLPLRMDADPVADMSRRLDQLDATASLAPERPALRQALGIIHLARRVRLSSLGAEAEPPLLAGL
jgi:hypothetical protein